MLVRDRLAVAPDGLDDRSGGRDWEGVLQNMREHTRPAHDDDERE